MTRARFVPVLALAGVAACAQAPSESPTRGRLELVAAESHAPLAAREADLFGSLYPDAHLRVRAATTREAYVALLADSVRAIVVDRPPNDEEHRAIAAQHLPIEQVRVAEDALGLMVQRANELETITPQQAADLLAGRITDWAQVRGSHRSGDVQLVTTGRNSGAWELLAERFFRGAGVPAPALVVPTQREVLEHVAADPAAVGVVSVATWKQAGAARAAAYSAGSPGWANGVPAGDASVRPLAILEPDSLGAPLVRALHQANIHLGIYPLHYPVYVVFNSGSRLAAGFSAFVASAPGQKLVLDAGLVPANMPVRLVQLD